MKPTLQPWVVCARIALAMALSCTAVSVGVANDDSESDGQPVGSPIKDKSQLAGRWYHVGKMQQFFGEDIIGIEFLKGTKLLLTGEGGESVTWDYAFEDEGRVSVTMGATDIWTCNTDGKTLTIEPASEPGQLYRYRRLPSGQTLMDAQRAAKKAGGGAAAPPPKLAPQASEPMGAPVTEGDLVETAINGMKIIGEVIANRGNLADLNLGQNNVSKYLEVQYMRVIQHAGKGGPSKFTAGDVVEFAYSPGNLIRGTVMKVNGDYCEIDSSGSGFTGWVAGSELRVIQKASPPAIDPTAAGLSINSGFTAPPGTRNPMGGLTFFLLNESVETILKQTGYRPPEGMSLLKGLVTMKASDPTSQPVVASVMSHAVAAMRTDLQGNGQFTPLKAGVYYLMGSTQVEKQPVFWNLRVQVKPGSNAISVDLKNAAAL